MVHRTKHLSLPLATSLVLLLAVSTASARRFAASSTTFRSTWTSLAFEENASFIVRCAVTLEGSLHSATISKVSGALIGHVTRATVAEGSCTGGSARADTETLPWHVRYESFVGTLPSIREVNTQLVGAKFTVEAAGSGLACTYASTSVNWWKLALRLGLTLWEIWQWLRERRAPVTGESPPLCPESLALEGEGSPTVLGSTTKIRIRLVT